MMPEPDARCTVDAEEITQAAALLKMQLLSVLSREEANSALSAASCALQSWQDNGFAGGMHYMQREIALHCSVDPYLINACSVLSFAVPYVGLPKAVCHAPGGGFPCGFGRVARYAWSRDYHRVIGQKLKNFVRVIQERLPGAMISWRGFVDAVPLLERTLSVAQGFGFIGKNTMHIIPGRGRRGEVFSGNVAQACGSYFFLGELLWNVKVEGRVRKLSPSGHCGSCERCLRSCPTSALVSSRVLDARRCISYLTIEKKGLFEPWEERAIGGWLFGCDKCQEVCPFNHSAHSEQEDADFYSARFYSAGAAGPYLSLADLLSISDDESFVKKYAGTALMRAGRDGLLRNACFVAVNTGCLEVVPLIERLAKADSSLVVQESARRALAGFGAKQ